MKTVIHSIFFVFLFVFQYSAQADSLSSSQGPKSPLIASLGYRIPLNTNRIINSGHGLSFELGLNLMYFFSKKEPSSPDALFGIYGGTALKDNFWNTRFCQSFINDYAHSIHVKDRNDLEQKVILSSKELFAEKKGTSVTLPGCETKSFHTSMQYYGLSTKIPLKNFHFILKVYTGKAKTSFLGGNIASSGTDFNYFAIKRSMYGAELSLFPGKKVMNRSREFKKITRMFLGAVSVYYEYYDTYNSVLYFSDGDNHISLPFKNYLSQEFLKKYKNEIQVGLKVSASIY